ncbi:MAG: hypothetical protein JW724_04070 [Candidatus Altiarchaeota archaeon]|nr:hypothetical protein [Candidatus Altiarchaeota archaeon]
MESRNEFAWGLCDKERGDIETEEEYEADRKTKRLFFLTLAAIISIALYPLFLLHAPSDADGFNKAIGAATRVTQEGADTPWNTGPLLMDAFLLAVAAFLARTLLSDMQSESGTKKR